MELFLLSCAGRALLRLSDEALVEGLLISLRENHSAPLTADAVPNLHLRSVKIEQVADTRPSLCVSAFHAAAHPSNYAFSTGRCFRA